MAIDLSEFELSKIPRRTKVKLDDADISLLDHFDKRWLTVKVIAERARISRCSANVRMLTGHQSSNRISHQTE